MDTTPKKKKLITRLAILIAIVLVLAIVSIILLKDNTKNDDVKKYEEILRNIDNIINSEDDVKQISNKEYFERFEFKVAEADEFANSTVTIESNIRMYIETKEKYLFEIDRNDIKHVTNVDEQEDKPVALITTNPTNMTVKAGDSATFNVSATVSGEPTYQWYYSSTNDITNGTLIKGATQKKYTMTATEEANGRYYYCIIDVTKNGRNIEVVSETALLTVNK